MREPVFDLKGITYSYPGGIKALDDVSFRVSGGESVAVLGANASGKTTLLKIMDGLLFPDGGEAAAFGHRLTEESVEKPPFSRMFRQEVGFLFQNSDAQLFNPTVREELAFGPYQLGVPEDEAWRRVDDMMKFVEIEHIADRPPAGLSSGEKKRVALACLLTCAPSILLMDEPTTSLDPRTQEWLVMILKTLRKEGMTLVCSTHDLHFASLVAERGVVLTEEHRVASDGNIWEILTDFDLLKKVNLVHEHLHEYEEVFHSHFHVHKREQEPDHVHAHGSE
ncbi:MAG: energy-coupling factor ABC transporter ATP-binding protein [Chloroflexi bacterium]|nr:energy-coupling factor ABC transporter ATP-binding protein [Chloroflexota bacterium]